MAVNGEVEHDGELIIETLALNESHAEFGDLRLLSFLLDDFVGGFGAKRSNDMIGALEDGVDQFVVLRRRFPPGGEVSVIPDGDERLLNRPRIGKSTRATETSETLRNQCLNLHNRTAYGSRDFRDVRDDFPKKKRYRRIKSRPIGVHARLTGSHRLCVCSALLLGEHLPQVPKSLTTVIGQSIVIRNTQ